MTRNQQRNLSLKTSLMDHLSPEPLKIFELNMYFDNQIMSSL